jgi:hypothetical protein
MVTSSTALAEGAIATVAATASAVNEAIENFFIRYFLSKGFIGLSENSCIPLSRGPKLLWGDG